MIGENGHQNALAIYKNKPALVKEQTGDKILIALSDGSTVKVREKDIEIIHPGPVKDFDAIGIEAAPHNVLREAWELLLAEASAGVSTGIAVSLKELAELAFGEYSPASAWACFCLLQDGLYFTGTASAICPRPQEQVEADEKKRAEKQQAGEERELFLVRLKKRQPIITADSAGGALATLDDRRFIQDIEALAYGKSGKSRTMKDIGLAETPEEAHALLLESGFWTEQINPHPGRFGVSLLPAKHIPALPPPENRADLTHLDAYAIDSPWSHDPDDAISLEVNGDGKQMLYVHVADPAASITADSPVEKEARDRGATLYLPEGTFRMLAEKALSIFALGLGEGGVPISPALTFKMTLNASGEIENTEIFPSTVKVTRLTYEKADTLANDSLRGLFAFAEQNLKRRLASGAINIELPEVHLGMVQGEVTIEPVVPYRSSGLVRECMLLAGEGAGLWALQRNVPFPYIEQEIAEMPDEILSGLAGSYQLRRCLRPRLLSVKPGRHQGLGLNIYTQVTSPLRRYTDLLTHIQIRAALKGDAPLPADEVAMRIGAGEAAALAVNQAERASRNHWIMVYLAGKKDSVWDAVALEKKGNRWVVNIPALALETQVPLRKEVAPNEHIKLIFKSAHIPKGEISFVADE